MKKIVRFIHRKMSNNEIEAAQQYMLELLYSQASDYLSSDHFQQHDVEDSGDGASLRECCIYTVPRTLRRSDKNEDAYTPLVVSIGPIHHREKRLKKMENHKEEMFQKFIDEAEPSRDDLFRLVQDLEPKVRKSYEPINWDKSDLVKLTLTDAGYIIQLFIMNYKRVRVGKDARLLQPSLGPYVYKDLLLLENQLPFFVIEELFNKAFPHNSGHNLPSFLELTYCYFQRFNVGKLESNDHNVKINHFTDLLRFFHLQRKSPDLQGKSPHLQGKSPTPRHRTDEPAGRNILRYNANELQEKGIKLKASDSYCLLDMKFSSNILEIPQLLVVSSTRRLFCNMIALEQCHYHDQAYISDYAHILDCLIDTDKDLDLLVSKKIVRNHSNEVASLFNVLGENVTPWDFNSNYLEICEKLNAHFQDRWIERMATLRRDYCRTPWKIVATIAGIVVILLTVVQTITSILQVRK